MENQDQHIQSLDNKQKNKCEVESKRKILQYYCKIDQEKHKKSRSQIFTKQNIEGFISIFEIEFNNIQFVQLNLLCAQIAELLQCSRKIHHEFGDQFQVLEEGCITKKVDCHLSMNQLIGGISSIRKKRNSTKQAFFGRQNKKKTPTIEKLFFKKNQTKKIQSNQKIEPKLLKYEPQDKKSYQCRSQAFCLQFDVLDIHKFQKCISNLERESLISFISTCLDIQYKKAILKFVSKVQRIVLHQNSLLQVQQSIVYLVNFGQIMLTTQTYKLILNKNSTIFKDQLKCFLKAECISSSSIIYAINFVDMEDAFQNYNKKSIQSIKLKLISNNEQRFQLFSCKQKIQEEVNELKEPLFPTQILNIKTFEQSSTKKFHKQQPNFQKSYIIPRPYSTQKSKRFRVPHPNSQQIYLDSNFSKFLSNYPYAKIVQSQQKTNNILKSLSPNKNNITNIDCLIMNQKDKNKFVKQIKRIYYNDKVRKLKIKNIAQKQIPNGYKKTFNAQKAQNEITQFSLFKNIFEYPTNGINQNANKQTKGKKLVEKFTKMSCLNQNQKISSVEKVNFISQQQKFQNIYKKEDDYLFQEECLNTISQTQSNNNKKHQIIGLKLFKNNEQDCSFFCTNILSPHLKTQRLIKYKKQKPNISNEKQNNEFRCQNQKQIYKTQKDSKNRSGFKKIYERLKTTQ